MQITGDDVTARPLPLIAGTVLGGSALGVLARARGWPPLARLAAPLVGAALGGAAGAALGALVDRFRPAPGSDHVSGARPVTVDARPHKDADELRVMSINIHQLVPDGLELGDAGEREAALADVVRYVREVDPDVVLVQEVDDDRARPGKGGVSEQHARLASLLGASDAAYAAATLGASGDRYGIAIYARNGIELDRERAVTLPHTPGFEARQLLLATARLPDGQSLTVANTHLDHTGRDRPRQLAALAREAAALDGVALLGGDLNDTTPVVDDALRGTRMANVLSLVADDEPTGTAHAPSFRDRRIDHLFLTRQLQLRDTWVEDVPMHQLGEGVGVTDHRAVVADVRLPSPPNARSGT